MDITDIIVSPLVTEKSHMLRDEKDPKVSFIVNMKANKHQIKSAFEALFGFAPIYVHTLIRKPRPARVTARSRKNFTKAFKIAYIKVSEANYQTLKDSMETPETSK